MIILTLHFSVSILIRPNYDGQKVYDVFSNTGNAVVRPLSSVVVSHIVEHLAQQQRLFS